MRIFSITAPGLLVALVSLLAPAVLLGQNFDKRKDVQGFIHDMVKEHGFDATELNNHFARVRSQSKVLRLIRRPAGKVLAWPEYRKRFINTGHIVGGKSFLRSYFNTLQRVETEYGIPAEIIVAIIGVETAYGRNTGRFSVFQALSTLAFDYPPRSEFFRDELSALLILSRQQQKNPLRYAGSYAGAMGIAQFLPSSILRWGEDFDRNGVIDLASSEDSIASIANYLREHGWHTGEPITYPVQVDHQLDVAAWVSEDLKTVHSVSELPIKNSSDYPDLPVALLKFTIPQRQPEYWLGYHNYYVITRYNRSQYYGMAVAQLAAELNAGQ